MTATRTLLLSLVFFSLGACVVSDDEEFVLNCYQSDWTETYTGTIRCDGENAEPVTVTVMASGDDQIIFEHTEGTLRLTSDPLPFTDCRVNSSFQSGSVNVTILAELTADGIEIDQTVSDGSTSRRCVITANR